MSDFPPPDPQAVQAVKRHKQQLLDQEEAQMARMADEWLEIERKLQYEVATLAREITEKYEAGEYPASEILRQEKYQSLAVQASIEAENYAEWATELSTDQQALLVSKGIDDTVEAIQLSYEGYGLDYPAFDLLPIESVENLIGAASNGAPLNKLFAEISDEAVLGMTGALIDGVSLGLPPAEVAKKMANGFGIGLDRALNIARTEQLNAYRRTSQAQYDRSGVIEGYRRIAQHTPATCPGCLFMDGEFFPNSVSFEEHPRGRCGMIPVVEGAPYPEFETGQDWFMKQPPDIQLRILGPGRYEAFEQGLPLKEFIGHRWNDEWGGSWVPRNVGDLPKPPGKPPIPVPDLPPTPTLPVVEEIVEDVTEKAVGSVKKALDEGISQSEMIDYFMAQGDISTETIDELGGFLDWANQSFYDINEKNIDAMFKTYQLHLETQTMTGITQARALFEASDEQFIKYFTTHEANGALLPEYEIWYNGLTEAKKRAIIQYTDGAYRDMNKALRSGLSFDDFIAGVKSRKEPLYHLKTVEDFQTMYDDLLSAFDDAIIPEDIVLQRGFHGEELYKMLDDTQIPDGYIIEESQFLSTAAKFETTPGWGTSEHQIVYEIQAAKGSTGMHVAREGIGIVGETEIILPPGAQLEILSTEKISRGGGRYYWNIVCKLMQ